MQIVIYSGIVRHLVIGKAQYFPGPPFRHLDTLVPVSGAVVGFTDLIGPHVGEFSFYGVGVPFAAFV